MNPLRNILAWSASSGGVAADAMYTAPGALFSMVRLRNCSSTSAKRFCRRTISVANSLERCSLGVADPAAPVNCASWELSLDSTPEVRSRSFLRRCCMCAEALSRSSLVMASIDVLILASSSVSCLNWGWFGVRFAICEIRSERRLLSAVFMLTMPASDDTISSASASSAAVEVPVLATLVRRAAASSLDVRAFTNSARTAAICSS